MKVGAGDTAYEPPGHAFFLKQHSSRSTLTRMVFNGWKRYVNDNNPANHRIFI
jgi:hypothetical protein